MAPGRQVFSTAKNGQYGKASGTSQAVPQVVAAAAILYERLLNASKVKARLIYTAEPLAPAHDDEVWGGILNVRRAVSHLERNVLRLENHSDLLDVDATTSTVRLRLKNLRVVAPTDGDAVGGASDRDIKLQFVLRISRRSDGIRIIFLDGSQMRLAWASDVVGRVPCVHMRQFIDDTWQPASPEYIQRCISGDGIRWSEVKEYVARINALPDEVLFTSR